MHEFFDIYTIIFLGLAIFVIFRLRAVLGQRTGEERPPFNPFERAEPPKPEGDSNVVPLPTPLNRPVEEPRRQPDLAERMRGIAEPESPVGQGLAALMNADPAFEPKDFVMGARAAYEMIVLAFARGDRKSLKDLLSKEVFDAFSGAISGREQRSEKMETAFVSIDKSDITEAELKGDSMQVTVKFVSKMITATRDSAGKVIEGDAEKIVDLVDVWTFARQAKSRDPNWRVITTDEGA